MRSVIGGRGLRAFLLVSGMFGALVTAVPEPAAAAAPTIVVSTPIRGCSYYRAPAGSGLNAGLCAPLETIPTGTQLTMLCWKDDYGERFFLVKLVSGHEGYVSASAVANQQTVNHCANAGLVTQKVLAVDWAFLTVGQSVAGQDVIQRWPSAASWATGPIGEYSGDCIKLAGFAWYKATGTTGYMADAIDVWNFYRSRGLAVAASTGQPPPYGAMVFYDSRVGDPRGHVGIAAGRTRIVATRGQDGDGASVVWSDLNYFAGYVGWVPIENLRDG